MSSQRVAATPTQLRSPALELELLRSSMEQMATRLAQIDESVHKLLNLIAASLAATQDHVDALHRDLRDMRAELRAMGRP